MIRKKIKLFLVDDHKMFLQGIFSMLDKIDHFDIVGIAYSAAEALPKIKFLNPDIVISDIEMPEMNGLVLTKEIKRYNSDIRVIITSPYNRASLMEKARNVNVEGYLLKNTGKIELIDSIHTVFRGNKYFSEEALKMYNKSLFACKKNSENSVTLSPREIDVLKCVSDEKNTNEIAKALYISINTVDTHRKNLMRKIGAKNVVGLVKYAIQPGIV